MELADQQEQMLTLLEPMAWMQIKASRGANAYNFGNVLEMWAERRNSDDAEDIVRRVCAFFLICIVHSD
jgi:hypothetical protein